VSKSPRWLLDFKANVFSQAGEDGVLAKILATLPKRDAWCVEFGAWDGEHLSNVCNLTRNAGYSGVLIECDPERFAALQQKYAGNAKLITLNRMVGYEGPDRLDAILGGTPIPKDFDLLSIDIDGNDYHVWEALTAYRPKVVCIEFNPTIPTEVDFVQPPDPRLNQGASVSALARLAQSKGYELVSVLEFNALFVRAEDFQVFEIDDNRPETLRADLSAITWLFTGFDGRVFLRGRQELPWHGMRMKESRLQVLPSFLQKYPPSYGSLRRRLFQWFRSLTSSKARKPSKTPPAPRS